MPDPSNYRFTVPPQYSQQRLDQVISACCDGLSRSYTRKLIDIGGVHVQGCRVRKCGLMVKSGCQIEIFIDGRPLEPYRIDSSELIYRDEYILSLNKPSGVVMQPTPARYKGSVYEAMLCLLHDPYRRHTKPELAMVQRLDRDTSGVVAFSIHKRSHKAMTACFAQRKVRKVYLALIAGQLDISVGSFHSLLARNRASGKMKSVTKGGKEAVTHYRVLDKAAEYTLLEVEILTGRTHQIRVHLSEAGWPIVGDTFYGGTAQVNGAGVGRSMLHARSLELNHPCVPDRQLHLTAPLPTDFCTALSHAGFSDASISQY